MTEDGVTSSPPQHLSNWWKPEDCTTGGDLLTTSPVGSASSPLSLGSDILRLGDNEEEDEDLMDESTPAPKRSKQGRFKGPVGSSSGDPPLIPRHLPWPLSLGWALLSLFLRRLGFGRTPEACLTVQQHTWYLMNRTLFDTPEVRAAFRPQTCPTLLALGEQNTIWDAFQMFVLVATRGLFFAERHGTVTRDGHLLILHRLRKVPVSVRKRFVRLEDVSLLGALCLWLRSHCKRKQHATPPPASANPAPAKMERGPPKQVLIFQHGLLESSINWICVAAPQRDGFLERTCRAIKNELNSMGNLLRGRSACPVRGERMPDLKRLSASLPFALLLRERDFDGLAGTSDALNLAQGLTETTSALSEVVWDEDESVFDIWLSNSRGNYFSTHVDHWGEYEPPLGHRPVCVDTVYRLLKTYNEQWTHFDMAANDIEAVYQAIRDATPAAGGILEPICVGFSQGASTFLMNAHHRMTRPGKHSRVRGAPSPFGRVFVPVEPKGLILLCPPVILEPKELLPSHIRRWTRWLCKPWSSLGEVLAYERILSLFFFLGLHHLGVLGTIIDLLVSFIPARFMIVADLFVRFGLRFQLGRMDVEAYTWSYKMTPNGLTSGCNIACFRRCIKGSQDYDHTLGTIAAQGLPTIGGLCPVHVVLGLGDNIANSVKSLQCIQREYPRAKRRLLNENGQVKWFDAAGTEEDLVVTLLENHGHLDVTWATSRNCPLHPHMFATIRYFMAARGEEEEEEQVSIS